jgi:hypothetical protein
LIELRPSSGDHARDPPGSSIDGGPSWIVSRPPIVIPARDLATTYGTFPDEVGRDRAARSAPAITRLTERGSGQPDGTLMRAWTEAAAGANRAARTTVESLLAQHDATQLPTIRRRLGDWAHAGNGRQLLRLALAAYDQMIGPDLDDLAVDWCITQGPVRGRGRRSQPG